MSHSGAGTPPGGARGGQGQAQAPALPAWPFPVGVFDTEIENSYDNTVTATTATKQFPDIEIEPEGWLRGVWCDFNIVATNTNTNTVVVKADFPTNSVNTVLLKGTNVPQTFGPFDGYDWGNVNKYGGYHEVGDPRADQGYSVTTSTSTAGGSAHFVLYLPMEIATHDALGDLQNQSDNSIYRIAVTLESTSVMYTTAPSGTVTCELTAVQDSYSEPVAALALSGRPIMDAPPLPGTRQCWQQEDDSAIVAASHTTKITNGIGYAYRNVILKLLDSSNTRSGGEGNWPDPLEIWLGGTRIKRHKQSVWKAKMTRDYAYITTVADSAQGPENGVRVLRWNRDVGMGPGNEARRKYLRTQDGNVFKLVGTYGGSGTLFITSNYVIPRGGPANNAQIVA